MKIAFLQDNFTPSHIEENAKRISKFYQDSCEAGMDIAIVPFEALCGFAPEDLLDFPDFADLLTKKQRGLVRATQADTALIFDTPFALDGSFSPAILVAFDGCIQHAIPQFRTEETDIQELVFNFKDNLVLCTTFSLLVNTNFARTLSPMKTIDTCIVLDANSFSSDTECRRYQAIKSLSTGMENVVYVDQAGSQNGIVLTGASCYFQRGKLRLQCPYFEARSVQIDTEATYTKTVASIVPDTKEKMTACIHHALVCGIRDYFKQCGITKAVLGLSGGIDSSVVLPLAVEALGRKNVTGLLMPSRFSTDHSVSDAVKLAENLQIHYEIIPIEPLYKTFLQQLDPIFRNMPFGLAEENIQARIRGNLLMAVANKTGAMLLNTSNKSEAACGYGTLYGDLCGGLSVLGDLYKSQVYDLARHINRKKEIIPENCITKAPSAELHPGQKDSDSLPDYDTIEKVLRLHLEQHWSEKEIAAEGLDKKSVKRILDLFYKNVFKRRQTPPVIQISNTCLERDILLPLVCR